MEENNFEWLMDIKPYISLEPNTMYYFPDGNGSFEELMNRVNPIQKMSDYADRVTWSDWFGRMVKNYPHSGINFIQIGPNFKLDGWCHSMKHSEMKCVGYNIVDMRKYLTDY